ncbi:phosphatidylinositol N-acetylglucosaminyltransferase gpi3 subunit [Sesamum indicum]|uniref:Phosphatidylinositol N-acetylglucosaminyltransferase gpi3 subunit n=1 Tax=Sesamum indicum TaxID=4182 RepID=A0A6I9TH02_SESIN|nr:phosphatidylinositol N-acetylglucosaminyltransferase gpi3 subunit [Sesamum indicum]
MGWKKPYCKPRYASSNSHKLYYCRTSLTILTLALLFGSAVYVFTPETRFWEPGFLHHEARYRGDLRDLNSPWNKLCFGPTSEKLKIAVFSKSWPTGPSPGGMERHASTLYSALASRGHKIHVFTAPSDRQQRSEVKEGNLSVHFAANDHGSVNFSLAYEMFLQENGSGDFDYVHTESVSLPYWRAKMLPKVAVTWHGIWYEIMHSKLFQELLANPNGLFPGPTTELQEAMPRLLDEIRFFSSYSQHICISNSAGEVLRNIYQLPQRNVHVILNGVDEKNFVFDPEAGLRFRKKHGVPSNVSLVMGVAGRLVRDKGHPLLYEAFSSIAKQHPGVFLLVAGSGPWSKRYSELGPNVRVLGALEPYELSDFYNALDLFINPTLRPQGLDLTLIEAMHCGKPVLTTNFPSITGTVVLSGEYGYTFSPNVGSLVEALNLAIRDGLKSLQEKGMFCRKHVLSMFTASKMALAYERFFLCMKNSKYCQYPLPTDC